MSKLPDSLLEFFQEDNGGYSATRLAFLLWAIGVLFVWIVVSIRQGALQPLNSDITAVIGILMTGKVVQKFGEKPANPDDGDQPKIPAPAPALVIAPLPAPQAAHAN